MNVELYESHLLDRLQQVAAERTRSVEKLLEVAVQMYLDSMTNKLALYLSVSV